MVKQISVVLKCLSPLSHGAFEEDVGNVVPIRRVRVVSLPGMPRVPCVSGNALRAVLRRLIMRDLFRRAGLDRTQLPPPKWDRLYAALANGGHLEGEQETAAKPDEIRALRESLPPLSVFGAALYTWLLSGHMEVGFLWPRCRETLAAGLVSEAPDIAAEDLVEEITLCRHVDRDQQDPEVSGVTPMPVTIETLCAGAVLESRITFARHATDIEVACVAHGLRMLRTLGGKCGAGFGVVSLDGAIDDMPYLEWLEKTTDLRQRLISLAEKLVRPSDAQKARPAKGGSSAGE